MWQTAGRFILQGFYFFTMPLFSRLLSPAEYGLVVIYGTWVSLLSIFLGLQVHGTIANAKISFSEKEIPAYLSSIISLSFFSFIFIFFFIVFFRKLFSTILGLNSSLIVVLVIHSFMSFCVNFYTEKLVQYKEVEKNTIISILITLFSIGLSLLLVFTLQNRSTGKILGNAIPQIIAGFFFIFVIYKNGKKIFDLSYWRFALALSLPLVLHSASGLILSQSDRVMLQKFSGDAEVGIYSFSYNIALVVSILWTSFNTSWVPFYYEYKKNNKTEELLKRTKNYISLFSCLVIGFLLIVPEVFKIMTPQNYWKGISLMPLIALAYYFNFLYSFPVNFEFYHKKTILISFGTTGAAIVNIILNFIFIPKYAEFGAAIATLVSYIMLFIFHDCSARFILKNYDYSFLLYLPWLLLLLATSIGYYFLLQLWYVRWILAFFLGIYLIQKIYISRTIL